MILMLSTKINKISRKISLAVEFDEIELRCSVAVSCKMGAWESAANVCIMHRSADDPVGHIPRQSISAPRWNSDGSHVFGFNWLRSMQISWWSDRSGQHPTSAGRPEDLRRTQTATESPSGGPWLHEFLSTVDVMNSSCCHRCKRCCQRFSCGSVFHFFFASQLLLHLHKFRWNFQLLTTPFRTGRCTNLFACSLLFLVDKKRIKIFAVDFHLSPSSWNIFQLARNKWPLGFSGNTTAGDNITFCVEQLGQGSPGRQQEQRDRVSDEAHLSALAASFFPHFFKKLFL